MHGVWLRLTLMVFLFGLTLEIIVMILLCTHHCCFKSPCPYFFVKSILWSYAVCTHGCCYFTAPMLPRFLRTHCCFSFSCAYFLQQIFFFKSFHECRTTPYESMEVQQLQACNWIFLVISLLYSRTELSDSRESFRKKKSVVKSKRRRIWNNSGLRRNLGSKSAVK